MGSHLPVQLSHAVPNPLRVVLLMDLQGEGGEPGGNGGSVEVQQPVAMPPDRPLEPPPNTNPPPLGATALATLPLILPISTTAEEDVVSYHQYSFLLPYTCN